MSKKVMTLAQVAAMDCLVLTPTQAASVMGCDPYYISVASQTPEGRTYLGFPVVRIGNRTKIPRIPFLRFLGWEGPINGAGEASA